jgi:uncharacterized protein (TIGR02001 family)
LAGGHIEMNVYAGLRPRITDKLTANVGVIGYFYPGAQDDGAELDYAEIFGKLSYELTEKLKIGGAVYFSPEFTGETGTSVYGEISAEYRISDLLAVSGAYGYQQADDANFSASPLSADQEYQTWNLGLTVTPSGVLDGFALDLRSVGTDIDDIDAADDRAVVSIKTAL